MEEGQEQRHCCRFCHKCFPSGRSLGGHMRCHLTIMNSAAKDEKQRLEKGSVDGNETGGDVTSRSKKKNRNCNKGLEASGHDVGYGLRENPKKTWRLSNSDDGHSPKGNVCKDCGKEFQSEKALYGHMRWHTYKSDILVVEEDTWGGAASRKQVLDSQSESESTGLKTKRRRSKRIRNGDFRSFSAVCASSSVSEIDQEQEDAAICLMMLSRGIWHWGTENSTAPESSVNESVISGRLNKMIARKDGGFIRKGDGSEKTEKPMAEKEEFFASDKENAWFGGEGSELGVSESGFLRDRAKKMELDASEDGFVRDFKFKKPKIYGFDTEFAGDGTGCDDVSDEELGKDSCKEVRPGCSDVELWMNSFAEAQTNSEVAGLGIDLSVKSGFYKVGSEFSKYGTPKRAKHNAYNMEIRRASSKPEASDNQLGKNPYKKSSFKCTNCNKIFLSHQALGGHKAGHKKAKGCCAPRDENRGNSSETIISPDQAFEEKPRTCNIEKLTDQEINQKNNVQMKTKIHKCPVCFKVFPSGPALGGHMRSHFVENSDARDETCRTIISQQQQLPQISDLLDLNLPAPVKEEINGHIGFNSWLVGSNHKHEPLLELVSS